MIWEIVLLFWVTFSVQGYPSGAISEQKVTIHHLINTENQNSNDGQNKNEYHEEYASADPSYEFSYKVSDPDTKDFKGQHETRHKDKVNGLYWLVEPYGQKRTVKYRSDGNQGFKAHVSYTASNDILEKHNNKNHGKNEHEKNENDEKVEDDKSLAPSKEENGDEGGNEVNHNGRQNNSNGNKNQMEEKHKPNNNGGQRRMHNKNKNEEQLINAAEQSEEKKEESTKDQGGEIENNENLKHMQHQSDDEIRKDNFNKNNLKISKHYGIARNKESHEKPRNHGHGNGRIEKMQLETNSQGHEQAKEEENEEKNDENSDESNNENNNENSNENDEELKNSKETGGNQSEESNESIEIEEDAHQYCNKKKSHKENYNDGGNRRRAINSNNSKKRVRNTALPHKAALSNINIQSKSEDEEKYEHHIIVHHPKHVAYKSKH